MKYMSLRPWIVALSLLLSVSCSAGAATADATPALHRGTNISAWLSWIHRKIYESDAREIKDAGFDFVRLPVEPELLHFKLDSDVPASQQLDFIEVDRAIAMMNSAGLAVVLDFHPLSEFKAELEKGGREDEKFIALWTALAAHYKSYPTNMLAYQLMNEPQYYNKGAQWAGLTQRLVAAVRSVDKDHLIILSGARGSSIEGLLETPLVDDPHVAYDFHFYEPYIITHQGSWWFGDSQIRYLQHVPYPSSLVDKSLISVSAGGDLDKAMEEVNKYVSEGWDEDHIDSRIAMAAHWAEQNHVRLLNLEFGVLLTRTDKASRYRWIADVRRAFEGNHIGWAVFDYTDSFSIVTPNGIMRDHADGSKSWDYPEPVYRTVDPAAVKALGLQRLTSRQ